MTVSSVYEPVQYTGNGVTTAFAFPYIFYDDTDIIVTLTLISTGVDTVQVNPTNYTLTGGDGATGTVNFVAAPSALYRVTIERSIPYTQEDNYVEGQAFPAQTIETAFDRGVIRDQQINATLDLALKFPSTIASGYVGILPVPEDGKLLGWSGATGTVANLAVADISTSLNTVFTGLASGDYIRYNGTEWVNRTPANVLVDLVAVGAVNIAGNQTITGAKTFTGAIAVNGTSSGPATLSLAEDTDNGSNKVTITAPSTLASDVTLTLPGTTGTLPLLTDVGALFINKVLNGLTLSNNVGDATNDIDIAAGTCISDDGTTIMTLSAITKRLDASWAVGTNQGGLDTGAVANNTYHLWVINRPDTNVTDVLFSLSASAPTMPANYTKKKLIGAIIRSAGAILGFVQTGNMFRLAVGIVDVNATNPGTSAVSRTITAPPSTSALVVASINNGTTNNNPMLITALSETDTVPTATLFSVKGPYTASVCHISVSLEIPLNTSSQLRSRIATSGASDNLIITTFGWRDTRI